MNEIQAAAESYSPAYLAAEKKMIQISAPLEITQEDLGRFNTINREYEKDLKKTKRSQILSEDVCATVEAELGFIDKEQTQLQLNVDKLKEELKGARQQFKDKKKKPENSKANGQPLRAKSDAALKRRGIDQAANFGGDLEGNRVRKLMAEAPAIIAEIEAYVLGMEMRVAGSNEEIKVVCEKHRQFFLCWEYFSGLRTKRFHLMDAISRKMKAYLYRSILLERHLGMSITPKTHVMLHSIALLIAIC